MSDRKPIDPPKGVGWFRKTVDGISGWARYDGMTADWVPDNPSSMTEPDQVCATCGHPRCHHWNHNDACFDPSCEETSACLAFVVAATDDVRQRVTDWLKEIELSQAVFSLRGLKVSYTPDELADLIVRIVGQRDAR